jgi:hypothetical protein
MVTGATKVTCDRKCHIFRTENMPSTIAVTKPRGSLKRKLNIFRLLQRCYTAVTLEMITLNPPIVIIALFVAGSDLPFGLQLQSHHVNPYGEPTDESLQDWNISGCLWSLIFEEGIRCPSHLRYRDSQPPV